MVCTFIDVASCKLLSALGCAGKHTLNSKLHSEIALFLHKSAVLNLFEVADIAGVVLIKLLVEFITCKNSFICIDNDYEIAAVYIGSEDRLIFPRRRTAASAATLPSGLPAASRTYQLRSISSAFGINVDILLSSKPSY